MLFCGDLSVPNEECGRRLREDMMQSGVFNDRTVVLNLEGVLHNNNPIDTFWKVYNDKSVLELKDVCKNVIFGLANNHIYDYPEQIEPMLSMLGEARIPYFGVADSNGNFNPLEFEDEGIEYAIFGHCWEVYTHTNSNKVTDDRVVDCTYQQFYKKVIVYINKHPERKVICFLHWNFDMEKYPFPAHKKLAHDLIDYGVEVVIGNHAHCEQEVEMYHGKVIAYGLGNFYMPDGYFFNGTLNYPVESHKMSVIDISGGGILLHEFETDTTEGKALRLIETSKLNQNMEVSHPESKYNEDAYEDFFKKNRIKRKFTPIFNTYDDGLGNRVKTGYCVRKINAIRFFKQLRDKKW
jgi:poly-gamma-glutamate synthesis protein (capsule biosynthesis protein)